MRRLLMSLFFAAVSAACLAQSGETASRLTRDTILIGDQVEWIIPLEVAPGEKYFLEDISDPPAPGVEIIKPLEMDTVRQSRSKIEIEGKVVLTSFDSGSYYLPNLIAMVEHGSGAIDTLFVQGPALEVTTVPVDTATYVIKPLKGQIKYPLTFGEVFPWVLLALVVGAAAYAVVRLIRMRRANRTFLGKPIVKDPPHIVALRSLEKIRKQKLWQSGRQKQFYTEVTDALRIYIADRFGIATLERPSKEMLADLKKQNMDESLYGSMSELFERADLVKFAKYEASEAENEEVVPGAVRFVNATYVTQIDQEEKK